MLVLGVVLCGCAPAPDVSEPNYFPQADSINRGGVGYLTAAEVETLQWLAWPQTYADMTGTFGLANRSTETQDIYIVEDTGREVCVFYEGKQATGYEIR